MTDCGVFLFSGSLLGRGGRVGSSAWGVDESWVREQGLPGAGKAPGGTGRAQARLRATLGTPWPLGTPWTLGTPWPRARPRRRQKEGWLVAEGRCVHGGSLLGVHPGKAVGRGDNHTGLPTWEV